MTTTLTKKNIIKDRISIPTKESVIFIQQREIAYIKADNNYSVVYLPDFSNYTICHTLREWEEMLNSELFYRCHRSYLVNINFIRGISRKKGNYISLQNGMVLPLARRKKLPFKDFLDTHLENTVY
jgi:two-component system LytT family response regulator